MRIFKSALATLLLLLAGAVSAPAQSSPFPQHYYWAADYGAWSIASQQANTFTFFPISICTVPSPTAGTFFPFNTNAAILISDATPANSEVVTPSSIVQTSSQCGVVVSPSNQHYTFHLVSGTGGLQEALNALVQPTAIPALVYLDRNWYAQAFTVTAVSGTTPSSMIGAAAGGVGVILADITTSPWTFYVWNGTAYSTTNNNWKNTAPTIAAGAASGSSPTVSNGATSTQLSTLANVTSGTATTTGTLFTETYPTVANGGFQYTGSCTVTSVGANSFTAFTVATSSTGSGTTFQRILTVTATSAPTVSTAYKFAVQCK